MRESKSWYTWLFPRRFDLVSTLLYLGTLGVYFYFNYARICSECSIDMPLGGILLGLTTLALLINDRLDYWLCNDKPSQRFAVLFLVMRIALIICTSLIDGFNFSMFVYLLIPYTAYPIFGTKITTALTTLAWLLGIYKFFNMGSHLSVDGDEIIFFIIYSVGLVFMFLMTQVVESEKESRHKAEKLLQELEKSHQQLQEYALRVADLATSEERNRLARDIHDSLGHYMTVINVQLEKALAFRDKQPATADQAVRDAKQMASEALTDIRRSVSVLRDSTSTFSLTDELQRLVNNSRGDHLAIALTVEGDEECLAQPVRMTLFRAAQEGLTNVQKHAQADQVQINLDLSNQQGRLELIDNGIGFDSASKAMPEDGTFLCKSHSS